MNESEDRAYGLIPDRLYTPIAPREMQVLKSFSGNRESRIHWAKLRLFDYFSRTGDTRARDKAKSL